MEKHTMIITFKNVTFLPYDFSGAVVEGKTLYIYSGSKTFDIEFKTSAEAREALAELNELLKSALGTSPGEAASPEAQIEQVLTKITDSIDTVTSTVTATLSGLFATATATAKKAAVDAVVNKAKGSIEERVETILGDLSSALASLGIVDDEETAKPKAKEPNREPQSKPQPEIIKKRRSFDADVFGATAVETPNETDQRELPLFTDVAGTPDEPLIGDLTHSELEDYIEQFMQDVMSNERVQSMFQSILSNFDAEKAADALSGYKKVVLTIALQNPEQTLTQVIQNYFM